jgi:hypothetical protein
MLRTLPLSLLLAEFLCAGTPQDDLFHETSQIESKLSAITGLNFKHPVPYAVITRDQLRQYLEAVVKKTLKPEDLRLQAAVLKMLGLVPNDFDLKTTMVDLLTEQAAAFYDYHKKKLFLLDNNSGPDGRQALVHELAHALADQNFHLDKYIKESGRSDDSETARLAVMEGQASWLVTAYMTGGEKGIPDFVLSDRQDLLSESAAGSPVFAKAPLYIQVSLIFPYAEGLRFQDALFRRYGRDAFSRVFRDPPLTTHQILHPDIYAEQARPKLPAAPDPPSGRHLRKQAEGTLGEIDLRVLLVQTVGKTQGEAAAAHLNGATYAYYETKQKQSPVLAFSTNWDTPEDARRFFDLYRQVLAKKWRKLDITLQTDSSLEGVGDAGQFRVRCAGSQVSSVEGSLN